MPYSYSYPARLERDEDGRYQVRFADLPDALTDGADRAEALTEAADCLSAAIASRIIDGEGIPDPSPLAPGQQLISPDPTIALKAALYAALQRRDMTVADLAHVLGVGDWHQAARLIDPKRSTKLTTLMAALDALRCQVEIVIKDVFAPENLTYLRDPGAKRAAVGVFRLEDDPLPARDAASPARDLKPRNEPRRRSALLLPVATPKSPSTRSRRKAKASSPD